MFNRRLGKKQHVNQYIFIVTSFLVFIWLSIFNSKLHYGLLIMTPALDLFTKGEDINAVSLTSLKVFYKQRMAVRSSWDWDR